jgi:ArsR family transcriptional regulator
MKLACRKQWKQSLAEGSAMLKAASDESRLAILCLLNQGEMCVCEIWPKLGIPQNLVSHHLKILKDAGFIKSRKDGLRVYYSLDPAKMKKIQNLLTHIFQSYEQS